MTYVNLALSGLERYYWRNRHCGFLARVFYEQVVCQTRNSLDVSSLRVASTSGGRHKVAGSRSSYVELRAWTTRTDISPAMELLAPISFLPYFISRKSFLAFASTTIWLFLVHLLIKQNTCMYFQMLAHHCMMMHLAEWNWSSMGLPVLLGRESSLVGFSLSLITMHCFPLPSVNFMMRKLVRVSEADSRPAIGRNFQHFVHLWPVGFASSVCMWQNRQPLTNCH